MCLYRMHRDNFTFLTLEMLAALFSGNWYHLSGYKEQIPEGRNLSIHRGENLNLRRFGNEGDAEMRCSFRTYLASLVKFESPTHCGTYVALQPTSVAVLLRGPHTEGPHCFSSTEPIRVVASVGARRS
jgi:hypothetical protein